MARISAKQRREKNRELKNTEIARRKANGEKPATLFLKETDLDFIDQLKQSLGLSSRAAAFAVLIEQARQSGFVQQQQQGG